MTGAIVAKYNRRVEALDSLLCVGLDPEFEKIPARFLEMEFPQFELNRFVIDATAEFCAAFKPNSAFYEARGLPGMRELGMTMEYLQTKYPDAVTILDAKRGDNGNTNRSYVRALFDVLGADAVTLHPYLGREALMPFLERADKGCVVLCRTSNPGAGEFQDLVVDGKPLWEIVAETVSGEWNVLGNCMLVVGATYPGEMRRIREVAPEMTLLVPGVGAQGGDVAAVVVAGMDAHGRGLMVSASRAVMFADDPAAVARGLRDEINAARQAAYVAR